MLTSDVGNSHGARPDGTSAACTSESTLRIKEDTNRIRVRQVDRIGGIDRVGPSDRLINYE